MDRDLFKPSGGKAVPAADAQNLAGGTAYSLGDKSALAQLSVTGCFGQTFYASKEAQLNDVLKVAMEVDPVFVGKAAVYARRRGYMKDMPAVLLAALAARSKNEPAAAQVLGKAFNLVVDNGKMLRNFVQVVRSGVTGRKSLGHMPKRLVADWILGRTDRQLFFDSVGAAPSMADVIKMVHPKPLNQVQRALFGYLIGGEHLFDCLPEVVKQYEAFKASRLLLHHDPEVADVPVPDVPFQMLDSLKLDSEDWKDVANKAGWQMTRMNLNTFAKHGVFDCPLVTKKMVARLQDPNEVIKAKVFPYQLLVAYLNAGNDVPSEVKEALQDAMEVATHNIPRFTRSNGNVLVLVDVSGSMKQSITGARGSTSSKVSCVDVASLIASCILRKNSGAVVWGFSDHVMELSLNPRDSVMTNAGKIAHLCGGGTNCSLPLVSAVNRNMRADLVIFVSDNESWIDSEVVHSRGTTTMQAWEKFRFYNHRAKLVCIDLVPNKTTQALDGGNVLNVGGFSDSVFDVINEFIDGRFAAEHFASTIESINLDAVEDWNLNLRRGAEGGLQKINISDKQKLANDERSEE